MDKRAQKKIDDLRALGYYVAKSDSKFDDLEDSEIIEYLEEERDYKVACEGGSIHEWDNSSSLSDFSDCEIISDLRDRGYTAPILTGNLSNDMIQEEISEMIEGVNYAKWLEVKDQIKNLLT